jgi:monooxygenase
MTEVDVLIVGAGISGIGGAVHLKQKCPGKSFVILEGRERLGGTWDLFKYPGIRSDSDMYTLGFEFKPWTEAKAIADAPSILNYLHETVDEFGLASHIQFESRVVDLSWSSDTQRWSVTTENGPSKTRNTISAGFVFMGTGYYSYTDPYKPDFPEEASFKGPVIHPQQWPEGLDYSGKKVVVIGSGATAVTLVPAMIDKGSGHVTMLQRSPGYIFSGPSEDWLAIAFNKYMPAKLAYALTRWRKIGMQLLSYSVAQKRPEKVKAKLFAQAEQEMGAEYQRLKKDLEPSYGPWDQRLCLIPDGDLFSVIRNKQADIVTGHIARFTATGIELKDGRHLDADIIISATGLKMEIMSGVSLSVDGRAVKLADTISYKGFMYSDVPNIVSSFGYSNASWTLKSDLIGNYMCRLLKHMDEHGFGSATPHDDTVVAQPESLMNLSSGYVDRALATLPKQGNREPWRAHHNYFLDRWNLKRGPIDNDMVFAPRKSGTKVAPQPVQEFAEAAE